MWSLLKNDELRVIGGGGMMVHDYLALPHAVSVGSTMPWAFQAG